MFRAYPAFPRLRFRRAFTMQPEGCLVPAAPPCLRQSYSLKPGVNPDMNQIKHPLSTSFLLQAQFRRAYSRTLLA
jgi:hypothetical protein